jgi:hypothetical protein
MGGDHYARPIETSSSSTGASAAAAQALSQTSMHADVNPANRSLSSISAHPIIINVDVTGSMGAWPRVIYDKLPMFYGQIMTKGYLADPSIGFQATGHFNDSAPLQVTDFAQGLEIDTELKKIYIESRGGHPESYELSAWFNNHKADFKAAAIKPFYFLIGDAPGHDSVPANVMTRIFGESSLGAAMDVKTEWHALQDKCNIFYMHKNFGHRDAQSLNYWESMVGANRIMKLENPKACVDAMLGVISICSGSRTLDTYITDMVDRGQDEERIAQVRAALEGCMSGIEQSSWNDDDLA